MARTLKWVRSGNLLHCYVRNTYYNGLGMRENHEGCATLGDVVKLAKHSQHVLRIMGFFFALSKPLLQGVSDLSEEKRNLLLMDRYSGVAFITSMALLHAKRNGLNPERVLDELYLTAFRDTVAELKLEDEKAIGIPPGGTVLEKNVKIDQKKMFKLPKWLMAVQAWRPGTELKIGIDEGRVYLESIEPTQQDVRADHAREFFSIQVGRIVDVVDHFMSNLCRSVPASLEELRGAIQENVNLTSYLGETDVNKIRGLLGTSE